MHACDKKKKYYEAEVTREQDVLCGVTMSDGNRTRVKKKGKRGKGEKRKSRIKYANFLLEHLRRNRKLPPNRQYNQYVGVT